MPQDKDKEYWLDVIKNITQRTSKTADTMTTGNFAHHKGSIKSKMKRIEGIIDLKLKKKDRRE